MDIKIFSAEHQIRHKGAFQKIKKVKNNNFDGELWFIANFKKETDEVRSIYQKTIATFEKNFLDKKYEDLFDQLEEALKQLNDDIKEDAEKLGEDLLRDGGILIALFAENELHFTLCGTPEVYFIRRGKFAIVSEGLFEQKKEGDLFANIASGDLKNDDKVIFTTTRILRYATGNQIMESISGGVLESIDSLKFILPEDEPLSVVAFHVKGLETLPFEEDVQKKGFVGSGHRKPLSQFNMGMLVNNFFKKIHNRNYPHKYIAMAIAGLLAVILVIIFTISILSPGISGTRAQRDKFASEIDQISKDFKNVDIKKLEGESETANKLLDDIEKRARQINEAGYFSSEVLGILDEVQRQRDEIDNITRISGAREVADLKTVKEDVDLRGILEYKGEHYVFDKNTLFKVLSANGEIQNTIALPENEKVIRAAAFPDHDLMIFLTESGKIIEVNEQEASFSTTSDEKFESAKDIATYSKYLYLLDPSRNQIWKYERLDGSFAGKQEYNFGADLSQMITLAIDGSIFTMSMDGKIRKLHRGQEQEYALKNVPNDGLGEIIKIYTTEELEHLFLLDRKGNRILIFTKGENEAYYERQIIVEDVDVRGMWVNPRNNRLFFVGKTKIYEIGL